MIDPLACLSVYAGTTSSISTAATEAGGGSDAGSANVSGSIVSVLQPVP